MFDSRVERGTGKLYFASAVARLKKFSRHGLRQATINEPILLCIAFLDFFVRLPFQREREREREKEREREREMGKGA